MTGVALTSGSARTSGRSLRGLAARPSNPVLVVAGLILSIGLWWLITAVVWGDRPLVYDFSPARCLEGLAELARSGVLLQDASASVFRLGAGLFVAALLGVLIGLVTGSSAALDAMTRPVLLFLRMISPLSWAPVALGVFGVGDAPVIALVAATAVWPVALATADGVRAVEPGHLLVASAMGATRWEALRYVTWPSLAPRLLGGLRAGIGIAWVVLVPAEMLGVTSGLGYQILNAKDQLAYHQITALILVIGTLGYLIDVVARWALRTPRDRAREARQAGDTPTARPRRSPSPSDSTAATTAAAPAGPGGP